MAGSDNIVFNTREKAISADQNDAQALEARTLATILRFMTMSRLSGLGSANDTETIHPQCNGLQVIPNGSDVLIKPGYLLQESASVVPVPGSLDSPYRIALNLVNMAPTQVAPSPVISTYYLLEAQMQEITEVTESRSVLNNTTGNFVATSVPKRRVRSLRTQWVGGTSNYPLPTGGDWVVLAGVFRPGGGGAVLQSHIQDMRLQPDLLIGEALIDRATRARVSQASVLENGDALVFLSADADVWSGTATNRGLRLYLRNVLGTTAFNGWNPAAAAYLDTTTTLAANTFYYLYLAPWAGLAPRTYNSISGSSRGVPVLSHVPPTAFKSGNGAVLNLPAPFGGQQAAAGTACCIAILRRNGANNGWMHVQGAGEHFKLRALDTSELQLATSSTVLSSFQIRAAIAEAALPRARLINMSVALFPVFSATGFDDAAELSLCATSDLNKCYDRVVVPMTSIIGTGPDVRVNLTAPYDSGGLTALYQQINGSTTSTGTVTAYVRGWTL